ncbi:hypothetical protein Cgig2_008680 [Carnegiea gigantea]|uniref:X8 domain-containing protein n=1 Tax=Carnegiea gigantea TaxID=171969 RepID=A0A9Q1JXB7_9CARY|nr:hypothetical protein Cgig2_008680 [Carnegiea gigantea]
MAAFRLIFSILFSLLFTPFAVQGKIVAEIKKPQGGDEPYVGVNIGTDVTNLLSPTDLASFLQLQKINHVRLYDADPDTLKALAHTKIRVIIGVPNNQLIALGSSNATAAAWIDRNVVPYYPDTLITAIAVGDEVLTTMPSTAPLLFPAIQSLYNALVASNLHTRIKVSTPHSASIILDPFPPSQAFFNTSMTQYLLPIFKFLSKTQSPIMMNLYPYYVFMENKGVVPLENSLFKPLTPSKEMVDPNTLLHYTNVYDAMIDSTYFSLKNLNITDVVVMVSETGGTFLANDTTNQTYCIAMDGVDTKTLQAALDWACGPGRANCSEIQPGEPCYQPNNVESHASYAFDSYYQKQGRASGSCDFKGVAMITTSDPSK